MTETQTVTAAILVIGDEILSGRTKDRNIGYIAEYVARIGVEVREVRVVPDAETEIVAALNALRARYDYVFSTGGIGPTHDDITADAVAKAFGVGIGEDPRALAIMMQRYQPADLTPRAGGCRNPRGGDLRKPGIQGAGLSDRQRHRDGWRAERDAGDARPRREGPAHRPDQMPSRRSRREACPKAATAARWERSPPAGPEVSIGSYPSFADGKFRNQIVVRGKDGAASLRRAAR